MMRIDERSLPKKVCLLNGSTQEIQNHLDHRLVLVNSLTFERIPTETANMI